jgi:rhodanese-related sulfurtransferase
LDVRRDEAFNKDDSLIIGAVHCSPQDVAQWSTHLSRSQPVVVYCVHGHEVSQGVAAVLRQSGLKAAYLEGGIAGWRESGLATRKNRGAAEAKWVTREHPKIDRIACPWLIRRFINPSAEFLYVPAADVVATPYDIKGVEFGHVGDNCSFDAIVKAFGISDPPLDQLATIVRGADTARPDLTPQCAGLLAISYGLSANHPDDHEMLKHGLVIYDALYRWCRIQQGHH